MRQKQRRNGRHSTYIDGRFRRLTSVRAGDAVLDPAVAFDPVDAEALGLRLFLALRLLGRIGRPRTGKIRRRRGRRGSARERNGGGEGKCDHGGSHVVLSEQAFSPACARLRFNKRSSLRTTVI